MVMFTSITSGQEIRALRDVYNMSRVWNGIFEKRHKRNKHETTHRIHRAVMRIHHYHRHPSSSSSSSSRWERDMRRHRRWQVDIRRRRSSNTHRIMKKNLIIFCKPTILTHFTFPINTIPIISCRGSIRLSVWLQDLQAVDLNNPALEYLSDLIPPTVSEISENYLRKSKYRSTSK